MPEELERLRAEKAQLTVRVVELTSKVTDLQIENASMKRALAMVAQAFVSLDSEQAFHDSVRRLLAGAT